MYDVTDAVGGPLDTGERQAGAGPERDAEAKSDDEFTIDLQRWAINIFILVHLVGIVAWNLPTTRLQQALADFYRPYMGITGSWQQWTMFSPDPVSLNTYLTATVHYKDGESRNFIFPRICKMNYIDKCKQERWRKFIENTQDNFHQVYWPYLARYAALSENYAPKTNPVYSVDLFRHQQSIVYGGSAHPEYLTVKIMTEHVITMPSNSSLLLGNR